MLADNGLEQMVKEATRESNILDQIITNEPYLVPCIEVQPGLSDHDLVFCEFNIYPQKKHRIPHKIPLYEKANWDDFKKAATELSSEIQDKKSTETTESLWMHFKTKMLDLIQQYIPHRTPSGKRNLPWVTPEIKYLIHERDKTSAKMKKSGSEEDRRLNRNLRRIVQRKLRRSFWCYLNDI